jgi:hypothetical protein
MYGVTRVLCCGLVLSSVAACGAGSKSPAVAATDSQPTPGATASPAPPTPEPGGSANTRALAMSPRSGGGLVLDNEHFTMRTVTDRQLNNMPMFVFMAPEKWRDQSQVTWNYGNVSNPTSNWTKVEDPGSPDAFYLYPNLALFWLNNNVNLRPGQESLGFIFARPMQAVATITTFAQNLHGREPGFQVVGSKMLPGLAEALQMPHDGTRRQGVGLKVRYTLNGKPVEEEFYGLYYNVNVPAGGGVVQTDWGLQMLHSFRAPAGELDKRREVFAAIPKSIRRNPAWQARYNAISRSLGEQFNRQLQAGYDNIAAAGRLSQQLTANSNAFLASVDASLGSSRTGGGGGGGGGVDKFDDLIRGVETTDDPYYGTSQHSTMETYHWTDGYGSYRNTNDPGANPNVTDSGTWTLMQPSQ